MSDDKPKGGGSTVLIHALVAALGLLLVVVLLVDWNAIRFDGGRVGTSDAQLRGNPVRIEARVSGYVQHVAVDDEQPVKAGQVLYVIEQDTYRADADRSAAMLAEAEAGLAEVEARIALQRAAVATAAANALAARANLLQSSPELARQNALAGTEGGARRALEQAVAADRRDRDTLAANQAATRAAQAQVDALEAQLASQRATVEGRRASLDLSQVNLGYTTVTAPEDGAVTARLVREGDYVTPGRPLITFVSLTDVWAVANYREEQIGSVRAGQRTEVHVDAYPDTIMWGHVDSIAPVSQARPAVLQPDRATGNFTKVVQRVPVKIVLNPGQSLSGRLQPGLSVETYIHDGAE